MKKRQMYLVRRERNLDGSVTEGSVCIHETEAAAIAYNKYYDCNVTMAQLVEILAKDMEYRSIHIKEIYTI